MLPMRLPHAASAPLPLLPCPLTPVLCLSALCLQAWMAGICWLL